MVVLVVLVGAYIAYFSNLYSWNDIRFAPDVLLARLTSGTTRYQWGQEARVAAAAFFVQGDYADAVPLYHLSYDIDPTRYDSLQFLSHATLLAVTKGQLPSSAATYAQVAEWDRLIIKNEPSYAMPYIDLALTLITSGTPSDYRQIPALLNTSLARVSSDASLSDMYKQRVHGDAYYYYALSYSDRGNKSQAVRYIRLALAINPTNSTYVDLAHTLGVTVPKTKS